MYDSNFVNLGQPFSHVRQHSNESCQNFYTKTGRTSHLPSTYKALQWCDISVMPSQIADKATVCSKAQSLFRLTPKEHQSSTLPDICAGKQRGQLDSPHKGSVKRKTFICYDVMKNPLKSCYSFNKNRHKEAVSTACSMDILYPMLGEFFSYLSL